MNKIEISVDVITNEITQKLSQFTSEELAYSEQITAQAETEKQQVITAKASAQAKLSALGLTADEVKILLGTT
jgi:hypothetical protein